MRLLQRKGRGHAQTKGAGTSSAAASAAPAAGAAKLPAKVKIEQGDPEDDQEDAELTPSCNVSAHNFLS